MIITGVYEISNTLTNKKYVGSAIDISNLHRNSLSKNKHHSIKLQRSYNKYGENYFKYKILEKCDPMVLIEKEQFYIDLFDSYNNGYNSVPFAGNNTGMKHTMKLNIN